MAHEFKARVTVEMIDIMLVTGKEVIDTEHLIAFGQQSINQMGANEACTAGHEDALASVLRASVCH